MARKKKVGDNSLENFISGTEGVAATTNYQQVLAEYDKNSNLVSFIAPDGTPYFISGQAGVNQLIAGQNVTLTPPSGQGNVRIDVMETGTVQSVDARWVNGLPNQPIIVRNGPITTSGVLEFDYGSGTFPPSILGTGTTGLGDKFLNSQGQWSDVIGTAIPFLRFNASVSGGFNQSFTNQILGVYNARAELLTVLANGVALTPPTISPSSAGSYTLSGTTLTITDYLEPNAIVEVISKVLIASQTTVGTVISVGLTAPQGLRQGVPAITSSGTFALQWDTGTSYIPQNSLGTGTVGLNTVLTGNTNNASWTPFQGSLADTQSTQTFTNKTLDGASSRNSPMPVLPDSFATKQYVDTVALGLTPYQVSLATIAPLDNTWTYSNGTAGVGATLTSVINLALLIDGVAPQLNNRLLIKNQSVLLQNGIYVVTQVGTATAPWILTRAADYDTWTELYHSLINVQNGGTLVSSSWISLVPATGVIGTNDISYALYSGVATIAPVQKGGTGRNNLTANQVLVGNDANSVISASNLYYSANNFLGIGTNSPTVALDIKNTARVQQVFEKVNVINSALSGTYTVDVSQGSVYLFTIPSSANFTFNFAWFNSTINNQMAIGDAISITLITNNASSAFYISTNPTIDGVSANITTIWQGVTRPTFGNVNSRDIYTFTIIKTANATYTILAVRAQYGGV